MATCEAVAAARKGLARVVFRACCSSCRFCEASSCVRAGKVSRLAKQYDEWYAKNGYHRRVSKKARRVAGPGSLLCGAAVGGAKGKCLASQMALSWDASVVEQGLDRERACATG